MKLKDKLPSAMSIITAELLNDPDYWQAWKANIAMAFKDEWVRTVGDHGPHKADYGDIHLVANQAADNFLNILTRKG